MKLIPVLLLLCVTSVAHAEEERMIRICDDTGCSDRPRSTTTFNPAAEVNTDAERRLAALKAKAEKDPRAAYDLGLRYFRGDGVRQDSYQALQWMRRTWRSQSPDGRWQALPDGSGGNGLRPGRGREMAVDCCRSRRQGSEKAARPGKRSQEE